MRPGLWSRLFQERQIYLRSEGEVRFVTLQPWKQVGLVCVALAGAFWIAYASISIAINGHLFSPDDERSYKARLDYEDRVAELRNTVDRLNDRLLLNQSGYLDKIDEVRADYEKLVERHRLLNDLFRRGQGPDSEPGEADDTGGRRGSLEDLAPAATQSSKGSLNQLTFRQRYAYEFRSAHEALMPLTELRRRFGEFGQLQLALLEDAASLSRTRAKEIEKLLANLGLSKKRLAAISAAEADGVGGPFIAASLGSFNAPELSESLEAAIQSITQEERLLAEVERLPLMSPVRGSSSVSSRFGLRRDPFRKVPAFHSGVDLRATYGAAVIATAPGKIVKAGWDGAYGRSVEIAHDNGISTVYAHLRSIKVKRGQRVAKGDVVGLVGSTGRSTGPHLHYETRIGGRSVDPARFWKARNALQALSQ